MGMQSVLERFVPPRFRKSVPVVNHVLLHGAIGIGGPMRPALTFKSVNPLLERAFRPKGLAAVAISVNSPGGSPVQSALMLMKLLARCCLAFLAALGGSGLLPGPWCACGHHWLSRQSRGSRVRGLSQSVFATAASHDERRVRAVRPRLLVSIVLLSLALAHV